MTKSQLFSVAAACIMAAACAGGGGGGIQMAPPIPTAASPPSPTASSPAFDGSGPYQSNVVFPLTVRTLDFTSGGLPPVMSDQNATAFVKTSAFNSAVVQLTVPSINIDTTITLDTNLATGHPQGLLGGLSYVSFGLWSETATTGGFGHMWAFAFGYETPVNAMPTTGTAIYTGANTVRGEVFVTAGGQTSWADLHGDAYLGANFATGKIEGTFYNMTAKNEVIFNSPWNDVSITATIAAGTTRFSGTTGIASSPNGPYVLKDSATGLVSGAFYGPNADNLGAVWSIGDGTATAIGAVGAWHNPWAY